LTMKFYYTLIKLVPDVAKGEFVIVGLVIGTGEPGEWRIRYDTEWMMRAQRLWGDDISALVKGASEYGYVELPEHLKTWDIEALQREVDSQLGYVQLRQILPAAGEQIVVIENMLVETFLNTDTVEGGLDNEPIST